MGQDATETTSTASGATSTSPVPAERPWWRALVIVGLLALMIVLVVAAVDAITPGPPEVTMMLFQDAPTGCDETTNHFIFPLEADLLNDGGPAAVTLRAYLDGVPALINGVNDSVSVYIGGPQGSASVRFTVAARDCALHAAYADIVSVVPA